MLGVNDFKSFIAKKKNNLNNINKNEKRSVNDLFDAKKKSDIQKNEKNMLIFFYYLHKILSKRPTFLRPNPFIDRIIYLNFFKRLLTGANLIKTRAASIKHKHTIQ